jgi:prepilin-type N-terminal cleavage/methylation domain-containing protein
MAVGFTLAELLIALTILGVIATFTIPKILSAQQGSAWNSEAKEVAGMITAAYQTHKLNGKLSLSTTAGDLTQYMNYVAVDTTTPIDDWVTGTTWGCASAAKCLKLHNGGMLAFDGHNFTYRNGSQQKDDFLIFQFDPDGKETDGTTNGPGKAICFTLYYDGGLGTADTARPGSYYSTYPDDYDPSWFHWN